MSLATVDVNEAQIAALGDPITGPSAFSGDFMRFWHLTFNIAKTQWKMRFFGSVLGYFWQLMRPLLLFGVLLVFWTVVAQINKAVPGPPGKYYAVQLLGAIVLFTFFQEATQGAVRAVVDSETLVRKIHFPRLAIPLASVMVALFNLVLNLVIELGFAVAMGVTPMWSWFQLPIIVAILVVLTTGVSMILSSLFVYFRDIQPIWEVVCQVLFYASPVLVPAILVQQHLNNPTLMKLYMLNPIAMLLEQFKHAVINHAVSGAAYYGGYGWVAISMVIVVVLLGLGYVIFSRMAPYVAENI
ncbi:MAG: ABC transporter permease [Solirubrobacterales bacterium]|nr:ABC transporter permease [Solirubrobacterales bacterium]